MKHQIFYEEVMIGQELPVVVECPTTMQLVKYAAAVNDYYQIHYDKDFATENGLSGVIVQGSLALSLLAKMITDWLGEKGEIKKIASSYRGINYVNEEMFCNGKVTGKYEEEGRKLITIDIWIENAEGAKTVTGNATVQIPAGD